MRKFKNNNSSCEILSNDGSWYFETIEFDYQPTKKSKKFVAYLFIFFFSISVIFFGNTYSKFISKKDGVATVQVAKWNVKVNEASSLDIKLADTITQNNFSNDYVIPGTKGIINLNLDFSDTQVDAKYILSIQRENLPDHLSFYSDENMSTSFEEETGLVSKENMSTPIIKKIYWKWNFTDDDETETWTEKDLSANITVDCQQQMR